MRKKVFVACSDKAICRLVRDILEEKDVDVHSLSDAARSGAHAAGECGDLFILDAPPASGRKSMQVLRERCPHARIIALVDSIDRSCRTGPGITYVQKPFTPSYIIDLVDRHMRDDEP